MGAADVVPGVSGGTVALILGHYQRLVTAISHIDSTALGLLRRRRLADCWQHIDGRFLLPLGIGILLAIGSLMSLMHWLLENHFPQTMAVFFGLVLTSGFLVARFVREWTATCISVAVLSAYLAYLIASLRPTDGQPSPLFLLAAGSIAICAMILPGISGAFVLLLLGAYHRASEMVKEFVHLEWSLPLFFDLAMFTLGCLSGLLLFTRLLRHLLQHYANVTFAALLGLMLGSLRKLWPLQQPTSETAELEFKDRIYELVALRQWEGPIWPLILLALAAAAAVLVIHILASKRQPTSEPQN